MSRTVVANNPVPILSGIYVSAELQQLMLIAGNAVSRIQYRIPVERNGCEIVQPGSVVVPAKYLLEWVRKLPPGVVTFEVSSAFLVTVRSGAAVCRIGGMNPEDYPSTPEKTAVYPAFRISNEALKRAIQQVAFAVSTSESRPVLTGVHCQVSNTALRLSASDSIRLAIGQAPIQRESETDAEVPPFIVPGKVLYDFSKMIPDTKEMTRIVVCSQQIRLQTEQLEAHLMLLLGTYPSVDRIIPSEFATEMVVSTSGFLEAIERVTLMSGEGNPVKLDSTCAKTVQFASRTAEIGEVFEEVPVRDLSGEAVSVCFNGKYMTDIVRAIDSTHLAVRFSGKSSPILLQPAGCPDSQYLLTPIRTHA